MQYLVSAGINHLSSSPYGSEITVNVVVGLANILKI
jgi:hypothetical protein